MFSSDVTRGSFVPDHASGDRDEAEPVEAPPEPEVLDRFRLRRKLGQGGMGQVWEAWDPRLERRVAVKRLLDAAPEARRRFLREARLQATIAHPGICPVFEVGQSAGEPYLVMQCLDGPPLDRAVEDGPLELKLDLVRQVAEAVHAAHGRALIHRDLKPSNILVEFPDDAPPRPVVVDFGIARPVADEALTASRDWVGTPAYMAPEQVNGKKSPLDRRTDVYALGATLYRLVAGRPPHGGQGTTLLLAIAREEPARLRSSHVPSEVEAIIFKCLEKRPEDRYGSARALAEDLGRYLAGEPVRARPVTRAVRLGKWLRRHRYPAQAVAAAVTVAAVASAWGLWTFWSAEKSRRTAQRFGAQIQEIEALARYSKLVPLHDVRPDEVVLRKRMDVIRGGLDTGGAPAFQALGRGHLALDELEAARSYLEQAHRLDPDHPEIAADLGRVLSELYRDRLATLERIGDTAGRESLQARLSDALSDTFGEPGEQRQQWRRSLGEPALALLRSGRSPDAADTIELEALILFHQGRPGEALELLAGAPPSPSWAYERLRLEGDIRRSWAVSLYGDGQASDREVVQRLEDARRAYGEALAVAQSHAGLLRDDAQTLLLSVRLGLVSADEVKPVLATARGRLDDARRIHPEEPPTWLWALRLELAAADHELAYGRDPEPYLDAALEAAKRGLELDPESSSLWYETARTHGKLARRLRQQGGDPTVFFQRAAEAFERVAEEDRDYLYFTSVGILHMSVAEHRAETGLDTGDAFTAAITAFGDAARLHSAPFAAWTNLGATLLRAAGEGTAESIDLLHRALDTFERARVLKPDHMVPWYYQGLIRLRLAQGGHGVRTLVDEIQAAQATADFLRATELAPDRFQPWTGLGEAAHVRAVSAYTRGDDPSPLFGEARRAHVRALELAPGQPTALLNLAWTAYFQGKVALRQGSEASTRLAEAEDLCGRSLEARRRINALLCLGSVYRLQAEDADRLGESARVVEKLREAERLFQEMLRLEPDHPEAHRSLGRLFTLEAAHLRKQGQDPASELRRARGFLDRAAELGSSEIPLHLAEARWSLEQVASLGVDGPRTEEALEAAEAALARAREQAPRSPEVARLEETLRRLRAKGSS